MTRILVVEDEVDLRFSLKHNLSFEGYDVDEAENGAVGLEMFRANSYDLITLDIMMPGMDGITLLKTIRETDDQIPIMMLTAKSTEMDKVIGFELGADDYLTKPFGLGELLARVKALLRRNRTSAPSGSRYRFLDIEVDFDNFVVKKGEKEIHFSQKEFLLLKYLIQRPGQAVDKVAALSAIWGYDADASSRTVDTHIARLRRKLGDKGNRIIVTVPTVGYKFVAEYTLV